MRILRAGHHGGRAQHDRHRTILISAIGGGYAVAVGGDVRGAVFIEDDGVTRRVGGGDGLDRSGRRDPLPRHARQRRPSRRQLAAARGRARPEDDRARRAGHRDNQFAVLHDIVLGRGQAVQEQLVLRILGTRGQRSDARLHNQVDPVGKVIGDNIVAVSADVGRAAGIECNRVTRGVDGRRLAHGIQQRYPLPGHPL